MHGSSEDESLRIIPAQICYQISRLAGHPLAGDKVFTTWPAADLWSRHTSLGARQHTQGQTLMLTFKIVLMCQL